MGTLNLEFNDSEAVLTTAGDLTVSKAKDFKEKLIEALEKADVVILRLQKIGAVDLAITQLLCATQREAVSRGKSLVVDKGDGPLGELIISAGLTNCDDGGTGCTRACWFKERGRE